MSDDLGNSLAFQGMKSCGRLVVSCLLLVACASNTTVPETTGPPSPDTTAAPTTTAPSSTSTPSPTTTDHEEEVLEIVLEIGVPVGGVVEIEVGVGDEVKFMVISDQDDELHVHGFDHYIELVANEPKLVSFVAEAPGVFEVESHRRQRLVAEVIVR